MAGFKRGGGSRGGGSGFKKNYTKKRSSPDGDDDAPRTNKKAKNEDEEEGDAEPVAPKLGKDDNGDSFVGLNASGKRRVTVSEFNKNILVSIREYWVDPSGDLKPGKKGISLTIEQYNTLLAAAPLIESVLVKKLVKKDIQVVRPDYNVDVEAAEQTEQTEEAEEAAEAEGEEVGKVDDDED